MPTPETPFSPLPPNDPTPAVDQRVHDLLAQGALPVNYSFNAARDGQGDLIFNHRRYLVTPNDEQFGTYSEIMEATSLPHVQADSRLSDAAVIFAEMPRDVRSIPQIIRSKQPTEGMNSGDVFFKIGQRLNELSVTKNVVPNPTTFSLGQLVVLRSEGDILFLPPIDFSEPTVLSKEQLVRSVRRDIQARYARFGGAALLEQFKKGLGYDLNGE